MPSTQKIFASLPLAPPEAIFQLTAAYKADQFQEKVDLGVGAYRVDCGKRWVLLVVKMVSMYYKLNSRPGRLPGCTTYFANPLQYCIATSLLIQKEFSEDEILDRKYQPITG
jgi:hypothetical protein